MIECLVMYVLIDMLNDVYMSILTRMTNLLTKMATNMYTMTKLTDMLPYNKVPHGMSYVANMIYKLFQ
jgi:hypothetical protein